MYPVIILLGYRKNLMATPGHRSSHVKKIPNLGGIGLFVAFSIALTILGSLAYLSPTSLTKLVSLLSAMIILFFLGVKDDIIGLSPRKKLIGQILSAALVVMTTDLRIHNLGGLFGLGDFPYLFSVAFTIFLFVFVVNAFNLVDGIDGLASAIAIIASATFGIFALLNHQYLMILTSFTLIGALAGFLRYNFSEKRKLFMGDSGSMFIGFLLAFQAFSFLAYQDNHYGAFTVSNAPILVLAILSFPLLDTIRVFIIRIKNKRSPFSADRNHIHHRLLDLGLKHKKATIMVSIINIVMIILAFAIGGLDINLQLIIICMAAPVLCLCPFLMERQQGKIKLVMPSFR
ncbi:MraY family glycosyltransferase [Arenibacter nanhaiticus]|nr:MraY family glycosyltransferase [Arenibacter nanhaiticus]